MSETGKIQVYTGNGKGKTTAAVGLAVRARSHNMKVRFISFHKEPRCWGGGEFKILKKIGVKVSCCAKKHPGFNKGVTAAEIRSECNKVLKDIKKIYDRDLCDVLVLDEVLIALRDGFLKEKEILKIMKEKPARMELILTGRGAPRNIIEKADLVSIIHEKKHYHRLGTVCRKGIEY
ncbi:MAG: cob(I)yrinic acid a,c-diamide adenosyltransferase [Candidatus Omnitrophica bacterium]|nr:cob(I)yrinic acid a,c-diamide adenosyltransferase [Candidatus Omnitrophota bacterium]